MWYHFFECVQNYSEPKNKSFLELESEVRPVMNTCLELAKSLETQKIVIANVRPVLKYKENFLKLMDVLNYKNVNAELIDALQKQLQKLESTLDLLQPFLTIFCVGDCFDTDELLNQIIHFRQNMDTLTFDRIGVIYKNLPIMDDLKWFYELRGSEIFLKMWRKHTATIKGKYDVLGTIKTIVPPIKKKWNVLFKLFDDKTITFKQIDEVFDKLPSAKYQNELIKLNITHRGIVIENENTEEWTRERMELLSIYKKLVLYRDHIPSLIRLAEYVYYSKNFTKFY